MTIARKSRVEIWRGLLLVLMPLTAQAEIVEVAERVEAFFPDGEYYTVQDSDSTTHVAHANRQDMTFYDVYLVRDHGDEPTEQWFRNFTEGQAFSVAGGVANITDISNQDDSIRGTFALSGRYQGMPYKKMCRLIMNTVDYATWCVSVLSENANTVKAWEDFLNHGDKFTLRD